MWLLCLCHVMLLSLYITARYVCVTRCNTQMSASVYCEFSVDWITSRAFFKGVLILESDTDLDSHWCKTPPHTITSKNDFYFVFIYQCFFLKDSSAVKCPKALALLRPMLLQMYPKKPKKTSSQCVPERHTPAVINVFCLHLQNINRLRWHFVCSYRLLLLLP